MSTMPSENVKVEQIHKTNTKQDLINTVLLKVNEISLDLHSFKVKSKEIQIQIQNDINSLELYADLSRLDELRLKKEDSLAKMLNALNYLNLELKEAAAVIAEVRKLSNPAEYSSTDKLNKEQTNKKLRVMTDALFCKTAHVKWFYIMVKSHLANERAQRELIANLLHKHLQNETLVQPPSVLKHKHGSLSKQTPCLSDMISEMNKMIGKLSFKPTDEVPASKPSLSDDKQPPTFEPGPTNIHRETEPQISGLSSDSNIFGAKQMALNNFSFSTVPEPTKVTEPLGSFKFEPPIFKPFEFKLADIHNETSKPHVNGLPSKLNIFGTKSASSDSSASQKASQESSFKFTLPTIKPFEFKPANNNNKTSKSEDNGPPSNPRANLSGAEPTTSDVSSPTQTSQKSSLKCEPSLNKPANIQTESSKPRGTGTTSVKFRPHVEIEQVDENGTTKNIALFNRCITILSEYKNKSLEELRFEDYCIFGLLERRQRNNCLHGNILTADLKVLDAVHVKFHPTNDWCEVEKEADKFQSITCMDEFKNRSFEEWRLGDYVIARVFHPETFGGSSKALDAVHVKFHPTNEINLIPFGIWNMPLTDKFQCITFMDEYKNKSLEELRLLDYMIARVFPPETFCANGMGTARVKFSPPTDIDTIVKAGTAKNITVKYQYITSIKEFENKSLEELRLEDYIAGRKGPTLDVFKSQQHNNLQNSNSESSINKTAEKSMKTPTQNGEIPTFDDASITKRKLRTAKRRDGTRTQKQETSTQNRETPTQNSEVPTQDRETPTQERKTSTENGTTPAQLGVSDENAAAAERLLKSGKNEEAVKICSDSLNLDPENVYFLVLRARAYYELKKYREALEDAQKAVGISPKLPVNGYVCIAKCCLALGQIAPGEQAVRHAMERAPSSYELRELREAFAGLRSQQEKGQRLMSQRKYFDVINVIDCCLKRYCPACSMMKLLKAECLAHTGKFQEARSIAIDTSLLCTSVQASSGAVHADAVYVIGLCAYYQEQDETAIKNFRKVLEHDPDHEKAIKMIKLTKTRKNTKLILEKKEKGNKAFNAGQWTRALMFYNEALSIDKNNKEENAKLHYNRATVFAKQNQPRNAIDACTAALELDENYIKALLRRAQCYTEIKMYEEALEDYEKLYHIDSTVENKRLLEEANKTLMANKGSYYYYKILGISKAANLDEIKKAYKKCAMRYHPDRHVGATLPEVRKNERKFKQVREAYDTLGETRSRANYDRAQRCYDDSSSDD